MTVRHCNIRGFFVGLSLAGGASDGGHAVEDNRFDGNTYLGLQVQGDGSVVRRNRVFNTGGSTANTDAYAIATYYSVDILDNTVSGATASGGSGYAYGIHTSANLSGRIIGNGVRGVLRSGTGQAFAIINSSSGRISLRKNDLVGTGAGSVGLFCSTVSGAAKNNIISGFASAIINCTDSGGNDIAP